MDTGSTSETRVREGCCASARISASHGGHQRLPLTSTSVTPARPRAPAVTSPGSLMSDPKRSGRHGALLHQVAGRDARAVGERNGCPRRATTPCSSPSAARSSSPRATAPTCRATPVPEGEDENSWFVKEVEKGLRFRYPDGIPDDGAQAGRLRGRRHHPDGLPGYFLVVADFINWAKDNGIRVGPGRGSVRAPCAPTPCGSPTSTRCSTA
jgi:DNA polymerase-3 subunit alpha